MVLIVVGLITGARHKFTGYSWLILVGLGVYFLILRNNWLPFNMRPLTFPFLFISLGLYLITKNKNKNSFNFRRQKTLPPPNNIEGEAHYNDATNDYQSSGDYLDISSLLGSNEQHLISKNFKGGKVSCIFGGAVIDLTQADFEGVITIDMFTAFGGVELAIPANWIVKNELVVILGGVEDKRRSFRNSEVIKTVVLKGNVLFGGVEIKSY